MLDLYMHTYTHMNTYIILYMIPSNINYIAQILYYVITFAMLFVKCEINNADLHSAFSAYLWKFRKWYIDSKGLVFGNITPTRQIVPNFWINSG